MKILNKVIIILFIACTSCTSEKEKLESEAKEFIKNETFKNDAAIEIQEFSLISYSKISMKSLDSIKLNKLSNDYLILLNKYNKQKKITEDNMDLFRIAKSLNWVTVANINKKKVEDEINKLQEIANEMESNTKEDSLIRMSIKNHSDQRNIYNAKFYIKAKINSNNKNMPTHNLSDTLNYLFNTKFKKI
jgi:hypothetical protein